MLSEDEIGRYQRHIVLKGLGAPGQNKLKAAKVLVVGAGGLGSPVIEYLAAAGVGTLSIADGDKVSLSNLQRQIIHRTDSVGTFKTDSAAEFVAALNPHVEVIVSREMITDMEDAVTLVGAHDVVIDGTDTFATRKLIARAAEVCRVPLVSGAVSMFDGQVTVFAPHLLATGGQPAPGFSDLYPRDPDVNALPRCEDVGILGAVTGVVGTLMAMEAIKLITGLGEPLLGRLMIYDSRNAKFSEIRYRRKLA
ncbi:MAG: molybdopterin-synthase adenylyltransferase MoeB [Hyphomicrobiaceae bacterium]|nr:molybdopterin-synthase adenylyltransferase MoeB [Hyphomicrobiaceae bacterium]MCC0024262.1 molybdopterin-synthase adenylyltransferase MoeB [Hyphomicrobiaceae bacterium]